MITPILFATVASFALGLIWFSPLMFGGVWSKLLGIHNKVITKSAMRHIRRSMVAQVSMTIVTSFVLYTLLSIGMELPAVYMFWFAFALPAYASPMLWQNRSYKLFLIEAGYSLVSVAFMSEILSLWI